MTPPTNTNRAATNLANAQHSTGPVTDAGKEKVRFNALKHGVCAKAVLLPHEDKEKFIELGESLRRVWRPDTELENKLLAELQECEWRLDRIRKAETNLLSLGIRENLATFADEEDLEVRRGLAEAAAWRANARHFSQFRRHENALLKEKDSLEGMLTRLMQFRVKQIEEQKAKAASEFSLRRPGGFVPHAAPAASPNPAAPVSSAALNVPGTTRGR